MLDRIIAGGEFGVSQVLHGRPVEIKNMSMEKKKKKKGSHTRWNDNPGSIKSNIVNPVVLKLGSAIDNAIELLLCIAGGIIQCHAVQVRYADDDLERMAQVARACNREGG